MAEEKETLFESLITQIQSMKPSWERTEQIEYLIRVLNTKPDRKSTRLNSSH